MLDAVFSFNLTGLLLCHFIGDYYLQTNYMAQAKESDLKYTAIHSVLYAVPFIVFLFGLFLLNLFSSTAAIIVFIAVALHAVIDIVKCLYEKSVSEKINFNETDSESVDSEKLDSENADSENSYSKNTYSKKLDSERFDSKKLDSKRFVYIADQILHLFVILCAAFFISQTGAFADVFVVFSGLKYVLFAVVIAKPVNVSFKKIFEKYQPPQNADEIEGISGSVSGAGAIIGILERLLTGIFVSIGQYAAIGLVFTAKSIARYDQISKSKAFAEYFLIGTLYSVLATLIVYYVVFVII